MLGGVALACVAGRGEAADASYRLSIPPRAYADALIDLGVQTNVSILGVSSCGPGGRSGLSGRYTLDTALQRILAGAPCQYRIVDAHTVRISRAPPERPAEPSPPLERPPSLVAEIVITATKRPVALERLPAGASAISREQIALTGAVDVGAAAGQLAGVITTNLGPGRDKLLVRGLSDGSFTGRTRSTVSTYLDNAPINYNAPDPDLRLVDVERVELVRGPQGALYGSGAIGGIYRIVTRKPNLERAEFGATAGTATTKGGDASRELDGYVSLPILKDHLGVRLVAYDEVQGGYLDDVNLRITNVDQTRRNGGRLAVRAQFDEHWRLDALATTQHLRSDDTQYATVSVADRSGTASLPAELADGPIDAPDNRANRVRETHNNDFSYVGATLTGDYAWGAVSSSVGYVHHVFSSQYDASDARLSFPASATTLGVYVEKARIDLVVQDLVVRSAGGEPFQWLLGLYGARSIERSPSTLDFLSPGPVVSTAYAERRKDRLVEYALYGEGSYDLGGGWTVTAGGRAFRTRVHTTADLEITAPYGPRSFDDASTFEGFSPKITLQREFANGDMLYVLMTEGYRPGGFNTSGFFAIRSARTNFEPDKLRNYEAGARIRRFDNRLSIRLAAYYDDWLNIQSDRYRQSGLPYTANVADARILGLESEIGYDWPFGLSLRLNGLLTDSKVRNVNPDFEAPVTPELPGVPKTSGGLLAVYERPLGSALTLRLSGEASYVGRSVLSFDNTASPPMGHYFRARLAAELATQHWRLTAYVTNPLSDAGDTFAYGNPFSFGQVRQVTPQRPRTIGVRLAAAF